MICGLFKNSLLLVLLINFYWNLAIYTHLHIIYDCFHTVTAELRGCDKDHGAYGDKKLTSTLQKNVGWILLYRAWNFCCCWAEIGASSLSLLMCWVCSAYWTFHVKMFSRVVNTSLEFRHRTMTEHTDLIVCGQDMALGAMKQQGS